MILIIEYSSTDFEFGTQRNHYLLPDESEITTELLVKAEIVLLINPEFRQLIEVRHTRFRTKDVYVALNENCPDDVRYYAERYGYRLLSFSSANEAYFINSILTVFHARISFGADVNDFRKMMGESGRVEYRHVMAPSLEEEIVQIKPARQTTSILTTLFYNKSYSFDAVDRLSVKLKEHFSTANIVSVFTESEDQPVSLGLFLAIE